MNKKRILLGVTASALILCAVANAADEKSAIQIPPAYVKVAQVSEAAESSSRKYMGRVEAIENVSLLARVSGTLQKINFKEGDLVKKGELLFEIEDTTYVAAVKTAEAQLKQAMAELEHAEKNYKRQSSLYSESIATETAVEDAVRSKKLAEANVLEKEAKLIDAKNNLSYTKIYSPINGRIGKSTYSVGNYVSPSSRALAEIVQDSPVYVTFAISEPDFLHMFGTAAEMKKDAIIRLRTADRKDYSDLDPVKGKDSSVGNVVLVDNAVDSSTGSLKIWAVFANNNGKLIPGGLVDIYVSKKTNKKYPAIPAAAIMLDNNGNFVYVVNKDNVVERRAVETIALSGNMYLIKSGLNIGENVIVDGTHKTYPTATVIPVPQNESKQTEIKTK